MPQTVQSVIGVYNKINSNGVKNYFKSALSDSFEYPDELHNVLSHNIPYKQLTSTERIMARSLEDASTNVPKEDIAKVNKYMTNPSIYKLSKQQNLLLSLTNNINKQSKPQLNVTSAQSQVRRQPQQTNQPSTVNENSKSIQQHNRQQYMQQAQEEQAEANGVDPQLTSQQIADEQAYEDQVPPEENNANQIPPEDDPNNIPPETDDQAEVAYRAMENEQSQPQAQNQDSQQHLTPQQQLDEQAYNEQVPPEEEDTSQNPQQQNLTPQQQLEEQQDQEAEDEYAYEQQQQQGAPVQQGSNQPVEDASQNTPSGFVPAGQEDYVESQQMNQPANSSQQSPQVKPKNQYSHKRRSNKYSSKYKKSHLSKAQLRDKWIKSTKKEIQQNKSEVTKGLDIYNNVSYQGKKYMKAKLQLAHYQPDQFSEMISGQSNSDPKKNKQLQKSEQRINDMANGIIRSQNDGHAMHVNKPVDAKEKQSIDNFTDNASTAVLKDSLVLRASKMHQQAQKQQAKERQNSLKDSINRAKENHTLEPSNNKLINLYKSLSKPGRQFMRTNMTLASENYIDYQLNKKLFVKLFNKETTGAHADKKIPDKQEKGFEDSILSWNMKRGFHGMNDALGGFKYTYGNKGMQVPRVHQDEALAIDKAMADPKNKAALASGSALPEIKKIDRANSDRAINYRLVTSVSKPSRDQIDQMRQYYLDLKPRSRRYMANIARHATQNYASMKRIVGTTPRDQLTQRERFESTNLYQMSHGEKKVTDAYGHTYFRKVGTPLPPAERKDIRRLFLDPSCAPYWAKGSFNQAVNELNNGIHTHDKDIAQNVPKEIPVTTAQYTRQLMHGLHFYDKLQKAGTPNVTNYFNKSLLLMQQNPRMYDRIRYADPKELSIHERNIKTKLNAVVDGKSPDVTGKLIQSGTPATPKDWRMKQKVDDFFAEPANQKMLKNRHGLNETIMQVRQKQNIQHMQGRGDILKRMMHSGRGVSSSLLGLGQSTGSMMRGLSNRLQMNPVKHHFSQARGHELYKRDIRRDLPGNDDPFER